MPKKRRWSHKYTIICDEVRFENNGKELILGVYADSLIVPQLPVKLKCLSFRITTTTDGKAFSRVRFAFKSPTGESISTIDATAMDDIVGKTEARAVFELPGVVLSQEGLHTIWFAFDGEPERVGEIDLQVNAESAIFN